jgi:hypothetical protein
MTNALVIQIVLVQSPSKMQARHSDDNASVVVPTHALGAQRSMTLRM